MLLGENYIKDICKKMPGLNLIRVPPHITLPNTSNGWMDTYFIVG